MQIPIKTEPLKALDVPTRWLLAQAFEDAAEYAKIQAVAAGEAEFEVNVPAAAPGEAERKASVYAQIAAAIRG